MNRLVPSLSVLLLAACIPLLTASTDARSSACVPGPSMLLVQTPKPNFASEGFEDGLRVVDSCGNERGKIDVPNPVFVVPTARPGVALVHTAGATGADSAGDSFLVDLRMLTWRRLAVPRMPPTTFAAGTLLISPSSTDSYAVVATKDVIEDISAGDRFDRLFVVDLRTATTVDIRPLLPEFTTDGTESGWVDDRTGTFYLDRGRQLVSVPLAHPEDAGRQQHGSLRSPSDYGGDRCASVLGDYSRASLHLCLSSDGSEVEWRVRRHARDPLQTLPELAGRSVLWGISVSSSGWIASPPTFSVVRSLASAVVDADIDRAVFFDEMSDSHYLFRPYVRDLSMLSFLDLESLTIETISGLPDGGHLAMLIMPDDSGDVALLSVAPFEGDYDEETDELWITGELYLIDFFKAKATLVGSNVGGVLSPDGMAMAISDLVGPLQSPALSVAPVSGPLIDVGPGFGTWLTP
jgi:hypothetical protein